MERAIIELDSARCGNCKARFDLPTLRERDNYNPGVCPLCGGYLKSVKIKHA